MSLQKRTLSSIILWLGLVVSILCLKTNAIVVWIVLMSLLSQMELSKMLRAMSLCPWPKMDLWLAGTFPLLLWLLPNNIECLGCIYIAYFGAILLGIIVRYPNAKTLLSSLFSFWYIPFNLHFFILLARQLEGNIALGVLLWIVCVTKFTDIGGFIIGCAFGKRKLAPQVSPKKTWEGVLGGVIFASCLGVSLTSLFPAFFPLNLLKSVLFACLLAGGAIVSDLVESVLKRQSQQKDSGSFIPGIGGALDLIDSLLLNAPVSYLLFQYF